MIGYEALARWNHPELGLISPQVFIEAIESDPTVSFLFCQLIIDYVCEALQDPSIKWISFNAAPQSMAQLEFVDMVIESLERFDISPERITIELTERIHNITPAIQSSLLRLREAGIGYCLDDFGTGYNSLARLLDITGCEKIKIDRLFISKLSEQRARSIVRHLVHLAHALDMSVIAEGVEKWEESIELWGLGCDYGQGYYFGKAEPLEQSDQ